MLTPNTKENNHHKPTLNSLTLLIESFHRDFSYAGHGNRKTQQQKGDLTQVIQASLDDAAAAQR